jgi:hypothetical protein
MTIFSRNFVRFFLLTNFKIRLLRLFFRKSEGFQVHLHVFFKFIIDGELLQVL